MISNWLAVVPAYYLGKALATLSYMVSPVSARGSGPLLVVEAGEAGWNEPAPGLLDIEQSAREYLAAENVRRLSIPRAHSGYLRTVLRTLKESRPSHYFYDTRTGSQHPGWGSLQALVLAVLFAWYGVIPLTILTNFPARRWRRQVSLVTALRGLILVLIPATLAKSWLPHDRIIGPIFMPLSEKTLRELQSDVSVRHSLRNEASVVFIGSMYEPRRAVVSSLKREFEESNINFESHERDLSAPKIDPATYWKVLQSSAFVFTTADHVHGQGAEGEYPPHMVYRYTEALAAGSCLIAPDLGCELVPFRHFIPFVGAPQLRETLSDMLKNPEQIEHIRVAGAKFIEDRVMRQAWWGELDAALGSDRLKS